MNEIEIAATQLSILDHVSVGLCLVREDCVVLFWNCCLEDWTHIPKSEIVGTNLCIRFPHLHQPKYQKRLQQVFRGGFPAIFSSLLHQTIVPAFLPNGQPRIQQTTVTAIPAFNESKSFYALMSIQDVTELTHRIEIYQAEIQQRQRIEDELQRSNTELEQFAYVASHDLQEPLRMVSSFTKLLEQNYSDKLDSQAQQFINFAVDGATRMQKLIDDLLMYSRLGRQEIAYKLIDCQSVLEKALFYLRGIVQQSSASIKWDSLPTLKADEGQLIQLFQNLIGNAIKYRSQRSPEVHIGAKRHEKEWLLWVRDNGIGIDLKQQERIFAIFQRLHTRKEYPGTGIGLSICKKIVECHGGRIWVESELGCGATFYFTILDIDLNGAS